MRAWIAQRIAGLSALGAFLLLLGLRFDLIRRYGSDLPFHDQWDAEALHLLRPWKAGAGLTEFIFRFHNEHHPVLTKLIALGLASVDGMWSALPQMQLNTIFQGGIVLMLVRFASRQLPPFGTWLVAVASALILSLPLLWENMLWGFQSQFYLAILLGLIHLDLIWARPQLGWQWALGTVVGFFTLGTIAAGFLSVTAGGIVAVTRLRQPGPGRHHAFGTLFFAALITFTGFAVIHPVPYAAVAHTPYSALEAFLVLAGWPLGRDAWAGVMLLPLVFLLIGPVLQRNKFNPWLLGLALWLVAMTAGFAYGRAALIDGATPRYCDFLAVQSLVGLVALLQFASGPSRWRIVGWSISALWIAVVGAGFLGELQIVRQNDDLGGRSALQSAQRQLVRNFIIGGDPHVFDSTPAARLIHESSEQRLALLRDDGIRALLPPSVRHPLSLKSEPVSHDYSLHPFTATDFFSPGVNLSPDPVHDAYFLSDWIRPESFPLLRFRVSGGVDGKSHRLRLLEGPEARGIDPLSWTRGSADQSLNFVMPTAPFRVEATAVAGTTAFSFSEPVSFSRLSWLAGKISGSHLIFTFTGCFLLIVAGVGACSNFLTRTSTPLVSVAAEPGRLRLLCYFTASVLVIVGFLGWPKPLVFTQGSRDRLLLEPTAWSAHAAPDLQFTASTNQAEIPVRGGVYNTLGSAEAYFGTFKSRGDADTADAVSTSFLIDANWLILPVAGYPSSSASLLAIEILDDQNRVQSSYRYQDSSPGERPRLWRLDLSHHRNQKARLHCVDQETGHQGWLGFSTPWLLDDPSPLKRWQSLADSNRLLWLRHLLLFGGVLTMLPGLFPAGRRP